MTAWTTVLFALLPHPTQPLVLAQRRGMRFVLPRIVHPDRIWASDTLTLTPLFETLVGAPVNVLRWVAFHRDEAAQITYRIHLLEPRENLIFDNALWQPLEAIMDDGEMPAALHAELARWQLEQRAEIIPERRAPWATPGWQAEAERWIAEQVTRLGRGAILSFESIKSWSISFVLRVNTNTGLLYFKATRDLPLWVNEGQFQARLAEMYLGQIPAPLAMNIPAGWMLLDDFGTVPEEDAPLDLQVRIMQNYARLQIDSARRLGALLAAGCKDRRIPTWHTHLDLLKEDDLILEPLKAEERIPLRERFVAKLPRFLKLVQDLDALPIPPTLVHGDLHAGNVVMHADQMIFFDWTDAAISHPFIDMIYIFQEKDETSCNILQEAYLEVWDEIFPRAVVRRAWALAQVVFGLYHAVSYYYIVHGIEPAVRAELNAAASYLQLALEQLEKYDHAGRGVN